MPHDKNGQAVKEGDRVAIFGTVKRVEVGEEYCNVTVETEEPMYPSDAPSSVTLNARQVVLANE